MYSRRQPPKKKTESKNIRTNLELPELKSMLSDFHVFDFLFKKNLRRGLKWNIRKNCETILHEYHCVFRFATFM